MRTNGSSLATPAMAKLLGALNQFILPRLRDKYMTTQQEVRDRIKGPIPGLPVLFTDDFQVNHAGMREYVNFLIDSGIKVLMLSIGISEYQHLSEGEIRAITKTVVDAAAR